MKKLLGTGAMLLLIIYLLPVGYRLWSGTALGDAAKDTLAVYAETGTETSASGGDGGTVGVSAEGASGQALTEDGSLNTQAAGGDAADGGTSSVWVTGGGSAGAADAAGTAGAAGAAGSGDAGAALPNGEITVSIHGETRTMPLESYVEGVVAAEISPDFPEEAIKAQAVAARTYAVYKVNAGRPMQHRDADVCDDYTHCAAYIDLTAAASARWGENADANTKKIQKAVQDTAGEILTADGKAIVAVFHAASAARTESARDIWGSDISYLKSVVSPGGSSCERYEGTVRMTHDEFRKKIAESYPSADLSGVPSRWFETSTRSDAGSVLVCTLGGVQVKGTDLREILGLNSSNFTLTIDEDTITFHTIGYGHGVGLSQYGAKYYAGQGYSYEKILAHYYPGTALAKLA